MRAWDFIRSRGGTPRLASRAGFAWILIAASTFRAEAIESRLPIFTIVPPKPAESVRFGDSLATSDAGLLAIGSPEYHWAPGAGVVRIYEPATGRFLRFIGNPSPYAGDGFGFSAAFGGASVFVASKYDRDGHDILRINLSTGEAGAPLDLSDRSRIAADGGFLVARDEGDVRVYESRLGAFVRSFPDLSGANADGPILLGSGRVAIANSEARTVWVADFETGEPIVTLANPDPGTVGDFGASIALRGDLLVVGATGGSGLDAAFLYDLRSPGAPATAIEPVLRSRFGEAVALTEAGEVLVGAPAMTNAFGGTGMARLYSGAGEPLMDLLPDRQATGFGGVVATQGNRIVVAAPEATAECCTGAGLVFVFKGSAPEPDPPPAPNVECGDLDGNGVVDAADLLINLLGTNAID